MDSKWLVILLIVVGGWFYFSQDQSKPPVDLPRPERPQRQVHRKKQLDPGPIHDSQPKPQPKIAILKAPVKVASSMVKYPDLDDSFAPFDEQGNMYITQLNQIGKHLVYHGDVLVGDTKDLDKLLKNRVIKRGIPAKWPQGRVPFVIDPDTANQEKIIEAIEYLNLMTNVKFVRRENQANYVRIVRGESDCYAYAGMIGGEQEIFLTPRCGVREILHEMMHTLGFYHEQNRGDRDQYIEVLWDNIDEVNHPQFKKMPLAFLSLSGRPFDFESIMLYNSYIFARSQQEPSLINRSGEIIPRSQSLLSEEDIKRINIAYPQ